MQPHKSKTPGRGDGTGAGKATSSEASIADVSQAGKALAVLRYCTGARTRAQTDEIFRAHPRWRHE